MDEIVDSTRKETLIILCLSFTTLIVAIVNRFRPYSWLPDSSVSVIAGLLLGFFLGNPSEADIGEELFTIIFFDLLMPTIAFAAALNENRTSILGVFFAIITTTFSTFCIGSIIEQHFLIHYTSEASCLMKGCMVWGVVLAPVNSNYVLSSYHEKDPLDDQREYEQQEVFEEEKKHPLLPIHKRLDSWLHCESILSGPIAIVFYTSLRQLPDDSDLSQTDHLVNFAKILLGSMILGSLMGLFTALTLRTPFEQDVKGGPYREVSLVILWSFASFFTARFLNLSAVGTLFCAGIVMKNTAMYVVTKQARHALRVGTDAIASVSEGFVMLYLSLASVSSIWKGVNVNFDPHIPFLVIAVSLITRTLFAIINSILLGGGGYRVFTFIVTLLSGMRGAVTYSLALKTVSTRRDLIATSGLIAMFSHIVLGPLLALYVHYNKPVEPPKYTRGNLTRRSVLLKETGPKNDYETLSNT